MIKPDGYKVIANHSFLFYSTCRAHQTFTYLNKPKISIQTRFLLKILGNSQKSRDGIQPKNWLIRIPCIADSADF